MKFLFIIFFSYFVEDSQFSEWTDWGLCSKSCIDPNPGAQKGQQTRSRTCLAAMNGGKECPHKIQEAGKYMGYDWGMIHAELATNNPLDLSTELDLNAVLTPNEKRELLGYEPLDETQLAILNAMENDNTNQQAGDNTQQV